MKIKLSSALELEKKLKSKPEHYWEKRGEKSALKLFHEMSRRVPAYKDFLNKNGVNAKKIRTINDFKQVPTIDKVNYLRSYRKADLCWDGKFKQQSWVISTTSGSAGAPYYFPRQDLQDRQYALTAELYLRANFNIQNKSTLYINAFPMGAWIGGVFTYEAIKKVAESGLYELSIITPGISIPEVIKSIQNLGSEFDQIIIGAYGPFLKDIIDEAIIEGVVWDDYDVGFVLSAETFSEIFRDYIASKTGVKNIYTFSLNHYGTVDMGTMSHETPLAILLRRMSLESEELYEKIFSESASLPTLTQYLPEMFYFEELEGNLLCSSFSGLPLVRYDLKDRGGIFSLNQILDSSPHLKKTLNNEIKSNNIDDTIWNLPFVYVYERNDFSVSFFAFQIYPETIKKALLNKNLQTKLTGKFTMLVNYDTDGNQYFEVNVELKKGKPENKNLISKIQDNIMEYLLKESSEYRKTCEELGAERLRPRVIAWPYHSKTFFKAGTKQKWTKK